MFARKTRMIATVVLMLGIAVATVGTARAGPVEQDITRLERECIDAYAANDLEKYFSYYADDLVAIFYNARTNLPDYRKFWTKNVRSGNRVIAVKLADIV